MCTWLVCTCSDHLHTTRLQRLSYNTSRCKLSEWSMNRFPEKVRDEAHSHSTTADPPGHAMLAYSIAATPKAAAPTTPAQSCDNRFAAPVYVDGAGAELLATMALLVKVARVLAGTDDEAGMVVMALLAVAVAEAVGSVMVTLADAQNETAN